MDRTNQSKFSKTLGHPKGQQSLEWAKFPLRDIREPSKKRGYRPPIKPDPMVLMGDYLIIVAVDDTDDGADKHDVESCYVFPRVLAVNLKDLSLQVVEIHPLDWDSSGFDFYRGSNFTLQKYNENQIILFDLFCCPQMLTIRSFKPFSIKWEKMNIEKKIRYCGATAQIYKDCFYMFDLNVRESLNNLWSYDLKKKAWKACETIGEGPELEYGTKTFIFKDNLYVHGGKDQKDIFMLNFDTMEWKKFEQQRDYFPQNKGYYEKAPLSGDIYKDHLVVLFTEKEEFDYEKQREPENTQLRCWNMNTNTWKIFKIEETKLDRHFGKLIVYKDLLLILGDSEEKICLSTYNLGNFGLEAPVPLKKEQNFMNESEYDIKFKIQGKIIYAHKKLLIKKSRFFAGLLKKQDVIEIKDCSFAIFQEFLRFIYKNEIEIANELFAFELLELADKHLQDDLKERCLGYLQSNINSKTVYTIFEKALEKNLQKLVNSCVIYLQDNNLRLENISELVQSLIKKNPEYPREFRGKVLDWIMENYFEIYQKQNQSLRLCEDFLIKNIEIETIPKISKFLVGDGDWEDWRTNFIKSHHLFILSGEVGSHSQEEHDEAEKKAKEVFKKETMKLRGAISFMKESWKEMIKKKETHQDLPNDLFEMISLALDTTNPENLMEAISFGLNDEEESMKNARGRKRKEPVKKDNEVAEKPELKKTKK